jgi:urease accessory protein UreF
VPQQIGMMETLNLKHHSASCQETRDQMQLLGAFGITGSSLRMSAEEVREHFALWVAEHARPFSVVHDHQVCSMFIIGFCNVMLTHLLKLQRLLHTDAQKFIPHCDTISKDIKHIYEATQANLIKEFAVSAFLAIHGMLWLKHMHLTGNNRCISHCPGLVPEQ